MGFNLGECARFKKCSKLYTSLKREIKSPRFSNMYCVEFLATLPDLLGFYNNRFQSIWLGTSVGIFKCNWDCDVRF